MSKRAKDSRPDPRAAIAILLRLTEALTDDRALEDSLHAVTDAALTLLPANHASVRLLDGSRTSLLSGARSGEGANERPMEIRRGEGIIGSVISQSKAISVDDALAHPNFKPGEGQGFDIRSIVAEPLWSSGDVIGVLSVSSPKVSAFTDDDRLLVRLLANCSVPPIEKARLRRLAIVDDMTLAFNHRYLAPRLREEMERSRRTATPLSVLLMDLDHFKLVNDAHGHAAGDAVLRHFAEKVRASVRRIDVFIRRGGEEFVLLMPSTGSDEAELTAERIKQTMADARIEVAEGKVISQTVSIGVATWDGDETAEAVERRADEAMYEAKRRGRNRVVTEEDPALSRRG